MCLAGPGPRCVGVDTFPSSCLQNSNEARSTSTTTNTTTTPTAPTAPTTGAPITTTVPANTAADTKVGHKSFQHPLTPVQESLLAGGPNFAIMPKYPQGDLCHSSGGGMHQVPPSEAEEFRSESSPLLRNYYPHQTQPHNRRMQSHQRT